jgi:hypothetical protein
MCYTRRWQRDERAREDQRIRDLLDREEQPTDRPVTVAESDHDEEMVELREKQPVVTAG